jgi:uncharacterized protein (TIGR04255 family)
MPNEIYPRAPVRFVSFVAGFPLSPALQAPGGKEAVYERLRERFPLLEGIHVSQLEVPLGIGSMLPPPTGASMPRQLRMTGPERTSSVTLGPRMVRFDCTDHESFERLEEEMRPIIEAVHEVGKPAGLLEVTLQYVNEIRHPDAVTPDDWTRFVLESAVGPTGLLGTEAQQTSGVAVYQLSEHQELRIGCHAAREGFVVDPNGPLRVKRHESGPFFSLNLESEWTTPDDAVRSFDVEQLLGIGRELHGPIHDAFEAIIKPELREYLRVDENADAS